MCVCVCVARRTFVPTRLFGAYNKNNEGMDVCRARTTDSAWVVVVVVVVVSLRFERLATSFPAPVRFWFSCKRKGGGSKMWKGLIYPVRFRLL